MNVKMSNPHNMYSHCHCASIDGAPCPPPTMPNEEFISYAKSRGLTEFDIRIVTYKCNLQRTLDKFDNDTSDIEQRSVTFQDAVTNKMLLYVLPFFGILILAGVLFAIITWYV